MKMLWRITKKINNCCGVTMMELLIVIAIISIALVPASTALVTGLNSFTIESENIERVYDAQNALDYITDRIRFNANQDVTFSTLIVNATETKCLQIKKGNNISKIYMDTSNDTIIEQITDTADVSIQEEKVLLENVSDLIFDNIIYKSEDSEQKISRFDISIVLEKKEYGQETFETTIYLRND